jgi:hypothetical protein
MPDARPPRRPTVGLWARSRAGPDRVDRSGGAPTSALMRPERSGSGRPGIGDPFDGLGDGGLGQSGVCGEPGCFFGQVGEVVYHRLHRRLGAVVALGGQGHLSPGGRFPAWAIVLGGRWRPAPLGDGLLDGRGVSHHGVDQAAMSRQALRRGKVPVPGSRLAESRARCNEVSPCWRRPTKNGSRSAILVRDRSDQRVGHPRPRRSPRAGGRAFHLGPRRPTPTGFDQAGVMEPAIDADAGRSLTTSFRRRPRPGPVWIGFNQLGGLRR